MIALSAAAIEVVSEVVDGLNRTKQDFLNLFVIMAILVDCDNI